MKHKHAEMIKAKVDNMGLVSLVNNHEVNEWQECDFDALISHEDVEFFVCLPQHKEACLHWLNGGEVEYCQDYKSQWFVFNADRDRQWSEESLFMRNEEVRIRPRREKRWVAVGRDDICFCNKNSIPAPGYRIIEIEV